MAPLAPSASPAAPVELELEAIVARRARLSDLRGDVVVLFYESRDAMDEADPLRHELARRAARGELVVRGIADLSAFDFSPARPMVRAFLRALCASNGGLDVWMDWTGELQRSPFHLKGASSHVLVIDREGYLTCRVSGPLDEAARQRVLDAVARASARQAA